MAKHVFREPLQIYKLTKKILQTAEEENITSASAALAMAEKMSREMHPIWPRRGQQIIDKLVETEWHKGNDYWRAESA